MPKYRYEIRYMLGTHFVDREVDAEIWEYDRDDETYNFIVKEEGDDSKTVISRSVFSIRTCHVVYVREVGAVDEQERLLPAQP